MPYQDDFFLRRVLQTITAHRMFKPGDRVLAGVSGGPDSMALLYALVSLSADLSVTVAVAHFNHQIRQEDAASDAEFVRAQAEQLALPFFFKKEDVLGYQKQHRMSLEEAARELRYRFLFDVAETQGFSKIALGHHADDNAEQVLMNLIRGSGLKGLSGIPAVRQRRVARPLIRSSKPEIDEFIRKRHIPFVMDASNQNRRHLRNRIRHHLMPLLKQQYNPAITNSLNRLAHIITDETEWISALIDKAFKENAAISGDKSIFLSLSWFEHAHPALKRHILRHAIQQIKGDIKRIGFSHLDAAIELASRGTDGKRIDLPDGIGVAIEKDQLKLSKGYAGPRRKKQDMAPAEAPDFSYVMFEAGFRPDRLHIPETGATLDFSPIDHNPADDIRSADPAIAFMDRDRLARPLIVRSIRPGDRFAPLGAGGSQKLKKFFINNKIPRHIRPLCPVLVSNNKIIWLGGLRISESVKVTDDTVKILKVELLLDK